MCELVLLQIRIARPMHAALKAAAQHEGRSVSKLVNQLLESYLLLRTCALNEDGSPSPAAELTAASPPWMAFSPPRRRGGRLRPNAGAQP